MLDLEITTNRPDCLCVRGVAREASAIYGLPLLDGGAAADAEEHGHGGGAGGIDLPITIESPDLCPRYAAAVDDVTIGPSPAWLAARLAAAGLRPINNVVDATNYVMLELGQPLHAFDLARLAGPALRVRRAAPGETLRTLDGRDHRLDSEMLVIADGERPQALAGVMGGAASEVSATTRTVVLESACFEPLSVRRTSKRTGSPPTRRSASSGARTARRRSPRCGGCGGCSPASPAAGRAGRSPTAIPRRGAPR